MLFDIFINSLTTAGLGSIVDEDEEVEEDRQELEWK